MRNVECESRIGRQYISNPRFRREKRNRRKIGGKSRFYRKASQSLLVGGQ